jgi:CubicO group peptidase (beta-lactamase class C family)
MADIENNVPLGPEHVFRQASLTKVALYTVLMMLYEQGRYLMSDPLYEYFPEWKNTTKMVKKDNGETVRVPTDKPVTVKNIMNFTCGQPYAVIIAGQKVSHPTALAMRKAMEPLEAKGRYTLREQIAAMADVPLAYEPGERHLYGFASELAAGMLEALCGKKAELVIKEMLFEPLGMDSSANFLFGDLEQRLVKDYVINPGKHLGDDNALGILSEEREKAMVGKLGETDGFQRVITNCRDYTKLMQMLANGGYYNGEKFLGRKTIDLMRTNTLTEKQIREDFTNNYLAGYGYGYGVRTLMDRYAGHHNGSLGAFGWTGGSGTWAEADPEEGVSIVYMHNLMPNMEEYHHLRMRAAAYGSLE